MATWLVLVLMWCVPGMWCIPVNPSNTLDLAVETVLLRITNTSSFKYIQVEMKVSDCSNETMYDFVGNRYVSKPTTTTTNLNLTYLESQRTHSYSVSMVGSNYTDTVFGSCACRRFEGFRVNAVGATIELLNSIPLDQIKKPAECEVSIYS